MIQLSTIYIFMIAMMALVGAMRGWGREIVATASIILALFAINQFDAVLFQPLLLGASTQTNFFIYILVLCLIAFIGYQTPAAAQRISENRLWAERREGLQGRVLGMVIGGINGYLFFGAVWYYLDRFQYPFPPSTFSPSAGTQSAAMVQSLPMIFLVQSNFLSVLVVVMFLMVLIAML
jgi:uncharacterized membrane protein required for colicin V production